jgi:hypothetical protein
MATIDPKDLVIGQGLQAYRYEPAFGVYLRLIAGQGEQTIDLDETSAWKLLQLLLADLERLAVAVYQVSGSDPGSRAELLLLGARSGLRQSCHGEHWL